MPQGEKLKSSSVLVPEKGEYARKKPANVRRAIPRGILVNAALAAALPGMIRNIEAIAAGKATRSATNMRLNDTRAMGQKEVDEQNRLSGKTSGGTKGANARAVTKLLDKSKNAKGVRGGFDIEELVELEPGLKEMLDTKTKRIVNSHLSNMEKKNEANTVGIGKHTFVAKNNNSFSGSGKGKGGKGLKYTHSSNIGGEEDDIDEEEDEDDEDNEGAGGSGGGAGSQKSTKGGGEKRSRDQSGLDNNHNNDNDDDDDDGHVKGSTTAEQGRNKRGKGNRDGKAKKGKLTVGEADAGLFASRADVAAEFGDAFL